MSLVNRCQMSIISRLVTKFLKKDEPKMLLAIEKFDEHGLTVRDSDDPLYKELRWHDRSNFIDLSEFWRIYKSL